ncbi:uncharacterized protein LOC131935838 [Physella acuta]|uniref:uncharacterized protein LOC131935838 n=1 Tax=Physella acuta TaxID=109671 RepID=UPI0027DB81BE|nr:uncharacterized protein LOC131935838 [Physella acuta]
MERQALLWMSLLMSFVVFKPLVHCAQCSADTDCTQSTSVMASCLSGRCGCTGSEYTPIRTGCGTRLGSPAITKEYGRSEDLFVGSTAPLTCRSNSGNPASYAWYKDGVKLPDSTPTINITQAGVYECQSISRDPALNSGNSSSLTITAVTGSEYATQTLTIRDPQAASTTISTGGSVGITCMNVPLGYKGILTIKNGNNIIAEPVSLSATIHMTAALSGATITCDLQPYESVSFKVPGTYTLPTIDDTMSVTKAEIGASDSFGSIGGDVTYNIGNDGPTFFCTVTETLDLLDSTNPPIIEFLVCEFLFLSNLKTFIFYYFKDFFVSIICILLSKDDASPPNIVQSGTSDIFILNTTQPSAAKYKCRVTYKGSSQDSTLSFKITVASGANPDPIITKVSTDDVTLGSTLVLACGDNSITSNYYSWTFNDLPIEGQGDKVIQLYNFTSDDMGLYKCRYRIDRYTTGDGTFSALPKPTITREPEGTFFGQYGDYVLRCNSGVSTTTGWTYSWKKGTIDLGVTTDVYSFTDADATEDNGTYTCNSLYKGASVPSDDFTVTIVEPGKRCTADSDCTGLKYTGKCSTTTPAVCVCAAHYRLKGDDCASGAAAIISCVLMVVMASLRSLVF